MSKSTKSPTSTCDRCKTIDFVSALSQTNLPSQGRVVAELGRLNEETSAADCQICPLLINARHWLREEDLTQKEWQLVALGCQNFFATRSENLTTTATRKCLIASVVLCAMPSEHSGWLREDRHLPSLFKNGWFITVTQSTAHLLYDVSPQQHYYGRIIDTSSSGVDYNFLQACISECSTNHLACKIAKARAGWQTAVIDCSTRTIVTLVDGMEYLALSYVWGQPTVASQTEKATEFHVGDVLSTCPATIEDAMLVVKGLGKRYLWIDKFCIDQSDVQAKDQQIKNMDQIYEGAVATIVAIGGKDPTYGLPGVKHNSKGRMPQHIADLGKIQIILTPTPAWMLLETSFWFSRAWTYQELVVSRGCLFFTDEVIYYGCRHGKMCEAIDKTQCDTHPSRSGSSAHFDLIRSDLALPDHSETYLGVSLEFQDHLEIYFGRNLTHESDSLDAFRGALARMPCASYWGIPLGHPDLEDKDEKGERVIVSPASKIAQGLMWSTVPDIQSPDCATRLEYDICRQKGFPSWSWTCLRRRVSYGNYWDSGHIKSNAKFLMLYEGSMVELAEHAAMMMRSGGGVVVSETSSSLFIKSEVISLKMKRAKPDGEIDLTESEDVRCEVGFSTSKSVNFEGWLHIDTYVEDNLDARLDEEVWQAVSIGTILATDHDPAALYWILLHPHKCAFRRIGILRTGSGPWYEDIAERQTVEIV